MNKHRISDQKSKNGMLAAYTDSLIERRATNISKGATDKELAQLMDTVKTIHSITNAIKPDEILKMNVYKKMQAEWIDDSKPRKQQKSSWYINLKHMLKQPALRRSSLTVAFLFLITVGLVSIIISMQPSTQVLQGTADTWKNGLIVGAFVLALLILIWMFIKDKK